MNIFRKGVVMMVFAVGAVGTILLQPGTASSATPNPTLDMAWVDDPEACPYTCRECDGPPQSTDAYHDIVTSISNNAKSSHLENCNQGSCTSHSCGIERLAAIGQTWSAARQARGADLAKILASDSVAVKFNATRGTLQFYCDAGVLVGNLPLTADQKESLAHSHE